jgi:NADH dehydrogenase FAD-containing subunit
VKLEKKKKEKKRKFESETSGKTKKLPSVVIKNFEFTHTHTHTQMRQLIYLIAHGIFVFAFSLYGAILALVGGAIALVPAPRQRPRLVIVGGGFTGCYVAKRVERYYETTLIDAKDYFEFTPSILRVLTEPNHWKAIQIPHTRYLDLRYASVQHGHVSVISSNEVVLATGERFPFDALVFATGSSYAQPIKETCEEAVFYASRGATLAHAHRQLRQSRSALIVGGGIVAVELAAEIVEHFGDKVKVTIAHSGDRLMSRPGGSIPAGVSAYCQRRLTEMGVDIQFNQRILKHSVGDHVYRSESGTEFRADVVFVCTGIVPNSDLLAASPQFSASLDEKRYAIVDEHMRLRGFDNIYCGGDVCNMREEKLAQAAEYQGSVIVHNLLAHGTSVPLASYAPVTRPILVSLGRVDGTFCWGSFFFTGFFAALMKEVVEFKVMVSYRWRFAAVVSRQAPSPVDEIKSQ